MSKTIIKIHKAIGPNGFFSSRYSAEQFNQEFEAAENDESCTCIVLDINSPGGSTMEGINMYNKVISSKKTTETVITGVAASMAAVLALASDKLKMYENSILMLHACSGLAYGNSKDIKAVLSLMEKTDNALIKSIAAKTGDTDEDIKAKWFDYSDHFMSAEECKEAKLCDEIIELRSKTAEDLKDKSFEEIMAYFNKGQAQESNFLDRMVESIQNRLNIKPKPAPTPKNFNEPKEEPMKIKSSFTALMALFSLEAKEGEEVIDHQPTEGQVQAVNDQLQAHTELNNALAQALKDAKIEDDATGTDAVQKLVDQIKDLGKKSGKFPKESGEDTPEAKEEEFLTAEDLELRAMYNEENPSK